MKLVRYLLITLVALIALVIAGAGAAFFLIPADRLVAIAADEVREATGRELTISGDISPSIYPVLGATVTEAALSNAEWAAGDKLITVGEAAVGVRVAPLLSGRIEIEEIRLVNAAIALEVSPDGAANWTFDGTSAKAAAGARGDAQPATPVTAAPSQRLEQIGHVRVALENAAISFDNRLTGRSFATRELSLTAQLDSPDQPLEVEGAGVLNDKPVNIALTLATPLKLANGEPALADLSLGFGGAQLAFKGAVTGYAGGAEPSAKGSLSFAAADLPDLIAAVGAGPVTTPRGTFQSLSMDGQLTLSQTFAELSGLAVTLDDQTVSGDASVDLSKTRPMISASMMADDLNLTPYLGAAESGGGGAGGSAGNSGGGGEPMNRGQTGAGWSTEPIDLSGMTAVDADVAIVARSVLLDKGAIRNADIDAKLRGGALTIAIRKLQMFDGGATGSIRVDGSGRPEIAADLAIDSVQLLALLSSLAEFDKLEGIGAVTMNVAGQGASLNDIMNSLSGTSSVTLTDGAILGINLAAMVRNATGAFLAADNGAQKTDFAEISASFDIRDGVATNSDLIFLGPLLRANGAGLIDIGAQSMNYKVTPRAVASLIGQGGDAGLAGVAVPVDITGPWSNLKFSPDLAGAITGIVTDPTSLAGTALDVTTGAGGLVGDIGAGVGGVVEGLLDGGSGGDAPAGAEAEGGSPPSDPIGGALKGLFGR